MVLLAILVGRKVVVFVAAFLSHKGRVKPKPFLFVVENFVLFSKLSPLLGWGYG